MYATPVAFRFSLGRRLRLARCADKFALSSSSSSSSLFSSFFSASFSFSASFRSVNFFLIEIVSSFSNSLSCSSRLLSDGADSLSDFSSFVVSVDLFGRRGPVSRARRARSDAIGYVEINAKELMKKDPQ